ncbi:hypothetical protein HFN89_04085 [Rhizobium laguerreae]|nr:hypothetical protein [Rhizobium laguerreae]
MILNRRTDMTATPTPAMAEPNEVDLIDPRDLKSKEGEMHITHKEYPIGGNSLVPGPGAATKSSNSGAKKGRNPQPEQRPNSMLENRSPLAAVSGG